MRKTGVDSKQRSAKVLDPDEARRRIKKTREEEAGYKNSGSEDSNSCEEEDTQDEDA